MGRACSVYGEKTRCTQDFSGEILREKDQLEGVRLYWRKILKLIFKKWNGGHGLD
jgi:hypothetical protein